MKQFKKCITFLFIFSIGLVFLTSCQQGPAEKKGKKIDQTIEDVKDKVQNKGAAQKAGEKLDNLTGN